MANAIDNAPPPIARDLLKREHGTASPVALYLARLAPESRATMYRTLRAVARIIWPTLGAGPEHAPWAAVTYEVASAVRARLANDYAPASGRRMMCALTGVIRECRRLGFITGDECLRICDQPPIRGSRVSPGRALSKPQLLLMLDACAGRHRARDRALVLTLAATGLRRSELAHLTRADVRAVGEGYHIKVLGKGNKERTIYIANGAADALRTYLAKRMGDPLFGIGTGDGVYRRISILAKRAGLGRVSPHDLRRTYATMALDKSKDVCLVASTMGHTDPRTTALYDRRDDDARRQLAETLDFS